MYNYQTDGYFKCDRCHNPLFEGDKFLRFNGERICQNCIDKEWWYASSEDSDYYDYVNREVHRRIEENNDE